MEEKFGSSEIKNDLTSENESKKAIYVKTDEMEEKFGSSEVENDHLKA